MEVKIKLLNQQAVLPKYAKYGDSGMDLTATTKTVDDFGNIVYGTSLALEIPFGFAGFIYPRSSNSKQDLYLTNHVGLVDSCYRGEIFVKYRPTAYEPRIYNVGDRIAQLVIMPVPQVEWQVVDELDMTNDRGGGFGSTGK